MMWTATLKYCRTRFDVSDSCTSAPKRKRVALWLMYVQALGSSERGAERRVKHVLQAKNPSKEVKTTSLTICLLKVLAPAGCLWLSALLIRDGGREKEVSAVKSSKRMQVWVGGESKLIQRFVGLRSDHILLRIERKGQICDVQLMGRCYGLEVKGRGWDCCFWDLGRWEMNKGDEARRAGEWGVISNRSYTST